MKAVKTTLLAINKHDNSALIELVKQQKVKLLYKMERCQSENSKELMWFYNHFLCHKALLVLAALNRQLEA